MSAASQAPLMNALAIAMVKNEADIVEAFVRHNLAFVDLMVVIDNDSSDGTREILTALQQEGLPLLVFDDPIFGYYQSEKLTHVYRKVVPVFQPELVYLLDADEFVHAPGRAELERALAQVPAGQFALLPWRTQLPPPDADTSRLLQDPLGTLTARRRQEEPVYYKAVIRRDPSHDQTLVIEQGNHAVHLAGGRPLPSARLGGVAIAHLPVRSVDQLSAKVINGWHAYLVKNRHRAQATAGFQWQQLYEQVVRGEGISPQTLCQTALDYAQQARASRCPAQDAVTDPVPARYGTLRHLGLARTSVLAKVALNMESYLREDGAATGPTRLAAPRDLAPLLELLRQTGCHSVYGLGEGLDWLPDLVGLRPTLQVAHGQAADLLLLPTHSPDTLAALAPQAAELATRRVVYWPASGRSPEALRRALDAWSAAGWQPHLLQTMGYRALASYAAQRQAAIVLQPASDADPAKAAAVRELLCTMEAQPAHWTDPAAQRIHHPMQDLRLDVALA